MIFIAVLVTLQALGAILGVGSIVWSEIAYVRALQDGTIDSAERAHLRHIARALRFGMSLLLLASLGLVVAAFVANNQSQPGFQSAYWVEMLLALLVIILSWAISKKKISFALGSASVFSAWWFLALLAFGQFPGLSLAEAIALYIVATAILFAVIWYLRMLLAPKSAV